MPRRVTQPAATGSGAAGEAGPVVAVAAGLVKPGQAFAEWNKSAFDAKGLPTAVLGKTGAAVPRIGIGLGSRFCAVTDEDKARAILEACLDRGFYYWDTAYSYRNKDIVSEERIGRDRRDRLLLADGEQPYAVRVAPGAAGRERNPRPYGFEPLGRELRSS